jgi:hypothetical protein
MTAIMKMSLGPPRHALTWRTGRTEPVIRRHWRPIACQI